LERLLRAELTGLSKENRSFILDGDQLRRGRFAPRRLTKMCLPPTRLTIRKGIPDAQAACLEVDGWSGAHPHPVGWGRPEQPRDASEGGPGAPSARWLRRRRGRALRPLALVTTKTNTATPKQEGYSPMGGSPVRFKVPCGML